MTNLSRLFALVCLTGSLLAGEPPATAAPEAEQIRHLEEQVTALLQAQQSLKEQQTLNEKRITDLQAQLRSMAERQPAPAPSGTREPVRFSGDLTFRYDLTDVRSRQNEVIPEGAEGTFRTRVRLNLQAPLSARSDAALQVTSGLSPSPTSPFATFGDAFRAKSFDLGRAYFTYRLGARSDLSAPVLLFGKMENPFWRAEAGAWASEIVWDNDVSPEGAALRVPLSRRGARVAVTNTIGGYLINFVPPRRFAGLTTDTFSIVDQLKVDAGRFKGAVSYLFYDHLNSGLHTPLFTPGEGIDPTPATDAFLLRPGLQNTNNRYSFGPNASGFGDDQFHILNLTGQVTLPAGKGKLQPFLVGEFLRNFSVDADRTGYGVTGGVTRGGTGKGAYTAWITYRDVDADATVATFADSDLGAGTDYKGFQTGITYRLQPNLAARLMYHDFKGSPRKTNAIRRVFLDLIRPF